MIGVLCWKEPWDQKRQKAVCVQEKSLLHMHVWQAEILRSDKTPEAVLRHRVASAQKKLKKRGVAQIILPAEYPDCALQKGLECVSTLALRQALAASWVQKALAEQGLRSAESKVAVVAQRLTGDVAKVVTELALRHRYVLLDTPYGGEELGRRLRKEYGISLLLQPTKTQLESVEALVLFSPCQKLEQKNPVRIPLYDAHAEMPPIVVTPDLEKKLPKGADRLQLLATLLQTGAIHAGADLTF